MALQLGPQLASLVPQKDTPVFAGPADAAAAGPKARAHVVLARVPVALEALGQAPLVA